MSTERAGEVRVGPLSVGVPLKVSHVLRHKCEHICGVVIDGANS